MDGVGKQIAFCNGIILEIGVGPGGGYMPYVLKENPEATVIISDLSPTVVREWKSFLDKSLDSPNIYYSAFDFCNMPFEDNSIDIISDGRSIGNCEGIKAKAPKEAFRVLKPGGKLITSTGFVSEKNDCGSKGGTVCFDTFFCNDEKEDFFYMQSGREGLSSCFFLLG